MTTPHPHCCPASDRGKQVSQTVSFLKIISELNRMRIICFLQSGPRNVGAITRSLDVPQNLASHHLKVLREADILLSERHGQEILYSVNAAHLAGHLDILQTVLHPSAKSSPKRSKQKTKKDR